MPGVRCPDTRMPSSEAGGPVTLLTIMAGKPRPPAQRARARQKSDKYMVYVICLFMCVCASVHMHENCVYVYVIYIYIYICVCVCVCMYVCMYVCMRGCMLIFIYVRPYGHVYHYIRLLMDDAISCYVLFGYNVCSSLFFIHSQTPTEL